LSAGQRISGPRQFCAI